MQLNICDPVPAVAFDSYMVEIQTVMGDADGYRDFTVGPFKRGEQEASLQNLLETLRRMDEASRSDYDDVLGFSEWFCVVRSIEEMRKYASALIARDGEKVHQEIMDLSTAHYEEWHMDPISGGTIPQGLSDYSVFYYDNAGVKHTVAIEDA